MNLLSQLGPDELPHLDIRVAFFDIDGTLLGKSGVYTQATADAITFLQEQGVRTAIASGRPNFAAQFIVDELGLSDTGVFCTGAHIYRPQCGTSHGMYALPKALCLNLRSAFKDAGVYYELYTERDYFFELEHDSIIGETHARHMRCQPRNDDFDRLIEEESILKFLIAVDNESAHETLYDLERDFPSCHFAYAKIADHPEWLFASIIDKHACKKSIFNQLLEHYDVQAENVMSFGDAQSDMIFLQAAGVGVAMGNASPQVQHVARYTTKPVWEDGVAYAIERLIRGKD